MRPIRLRAMGAALALSASAAMAGPYSSYQGVTSGAPDNPIQRSQFTVFESSVVLYAPAPGVGSNFQNYTSSVASLGELYSPIPSPSGTNSPFDKRYQPQTGTEPSSLHQGSAVSPFGGNINDPADSYGFIGIDNPGSITLGFGGNVIYDGPGADFAVFENGFNFGGPTSLLAELAYVEVSSNGTDFARFDSISLNTAPTAISGTFQGYDMTNVYNLAGKHASNWGTPFDLNELATDPLVTGGLLDLSSIKFVRLVDVVGSGPLLDSSSNVIPGVARDSIGNPILDNWVTFDSAGFDYLGLQTKAVGVVHAAVPEAGPLALALAGFTAALGARWRQSARRRVGSLGG